MDPRAVQTHVVPWGIWKDKGQEADVSKAVLGCVKLRVSSSRAVGAGKKEQS